MMIKKKKRTTLKSGAKQKQTRQALNSNRELCKSVLLQLYVYGEGPLIPDRSFVTLLIIHGS